MTLMSSEMELCSFTQPPESRKLASYLKAHYPGAEFQCVYEAGFSGFTAQRELSAEGINCIVIHPADVPTTDREKRQKSDVIDSRKLVRGLKNGDLKPLYVPGLQQQQDRSLLRTYDKLVRNTTRVKNRIKFFFDVIWFGYSVRISR